MQYSYGMFGLNWICFLLIIGIILAIIFIPFPKSKKKGNAVDVLYRKFADGTLSVDEFEKRKAILEENKIKQKE